MRRRHYEQTRDVHQEVFKENQLSLDNWTLNTPMELVRQKYGDQTVERLWTKIRDTGGDGFDAMTANSALLMFMAGAKNSDSFKVRQPAEAWLSHFDDVSEWQDIISDTASNATNNSINSVKEFFKDTFNENPFSEFNYTELMNLITGKTNEGGVGGSAGTEAVQGSNGSDHQVPRDPLVLDLDGDGVELNGLDTSQAYFDLNGDGFATHTSWLSKDDAFLAMDRDEDGKINNIKELFGSPERTGYEELTELDSNADNIIDKNDVAFEKLQLWQDQNGDGKSQADELTTLTEAGIHSISLDYTEVSEQNGDAQIARTGSFTWKDGTQGTAAETTGVAADVLFTSNPTRTQFTGEVAIDPEVTRVANIKGYGQIPDLHVAMSLDLEFKQQVLGLLSQNNVEALIKEFDSLLVHWAGVKDIALKDLDSNSQLSIDPATGKVRFDLARENFTPEELGVIKKYSGLETLKLGDGQWRVRGNVFTTGGYYRQAYNGLKRNLLAKFAVANKLLEDIAPGLSYNVDSDLIHTPINFDASLVEEIISHHKVPNNDSSPNKYWLALTALMEVDPSVKKNIIAHIADFSLSGQEQDIQSILTNFDNPLAKLNDIGSNTVVSESGKTYTYGDAQSDLVLGNEETNSLYGRSGSDILLGYTGDDKLEGGLGDDILVGGQGHDILKGGLGSDRYYFNLGDGQDRIYDQDRSNRSQDTLVFGEGITADQLQLSRHGSDLIIRVANSEDQIRIDRHFFRDRYQLEFLEINGEQVALQSLIDRQLILVEGATDQNDRLEGGAESNKIAGLAGNDCLRGAEGNDYLDGGAGNDRLDGGQGDDVLIGSKGNDVLKGGLGANQYRFNLGDGQDVIDYYHRAHHSQDTLVFGEGITLENLDFSRYQQNLIITISGTLDQVTINKYFHREDFEFKFLQINDELIELPALIDGINLAEGATQGNDYLKGSSGQDRLVGLAGNDKLRGYGGNDYLSGDDGSDRLFGGAGNDHLHGGTGRDVLDGEQGDDVLQGGKGRDVLVGGLGSDQYHFALGDGQDLIRNVDASHSTDTLIFNAGITAQNLWFSRSGLHLQIDVLGSDDQIKVERWYRRDRHCLDAIETADQKLSKSAVERLVRAMASFNSDAEDEDAPSSMPPPLQASLGEYWAMKS